MSRRRSLACLALFSLTALAAAGSTHASTQKRVAGIITAVEAHDVTITTAHGNKIVSGRVDPARTKVLVDGHAAAPSDLRVTYSAKADLGLDDVWETISATK